MILVHYYLVLKISNICYKKLLVITSYHQEQKDLLVDIFLLIL